MSEDIYIVIGGWIITTLAIERTTEIINDSKFFFPLKQWLGRVALDENTPRTISKLLFAFIHSIVSCSWCLSVWVSMFFCWFLPGGYFCLVAPHNILVKWLALVGASNLWHAIFRLIFRGRVITVDIKHTIEMGGDEDEMSELGIVIGEGDGGDPESDEPEKDNSAAS